MHYELASANTSGVNQYILGIKTKGENLGKKKPPQGVKPDTWKSLAEKRRLQIIELTEALNQKSQKDAADLADKNNRIQILEIKLSDSQRHVGELWQVLKQVASVSFKAKRFCVNDTKSPQS